MSLTIRTARFAGVDSKSHDTISRNTRNQPNQVFDVLCELLTRRGLRQQMERTCQKMVLKFDAASSAGLRTANRRLERFRQRVMVSFNTPE